MNVKLTIAERYAVNGILPVKHEFGMLKHLRVLREALELTDAEKKEFGFKMVEDAEGHPTGAANWDSEHAETEREIPFGDTVFELTVKTLKKLSEDKELHTGQMTLYEKFVEPGPPAEDVAGDAVM